jgi:HD-like signal output (HDOD) protein
VLSPLGQQTIKRVSERLESGESAGLSEIVELIQRLSTNAFETSVQELATLIGKDVVVTAKVIAAANTIGYNPACVQVTTITEAIHVIGFNKIRQLTVSLLLMESANRSLNASEKREIAALALCSGLMAESVMAQRGTISPEHAFICASLRSYGRLLMTSFMIDDYRRARIMATSGVAEDEAFTRVFGLTPLELGYHLLSSAHLPDPILKSLKALPPGVVKSAIQNPELELIALSDLSVNVCELALRPDVSAPEFTKRAQAIAAKTGTLFNLDADGLVSILRKTGEQLNEFAHTFGLTALADQFAPRLEARFSGADPSGTRDAFEDSSAASAKSAIGLSNESAPPDHAKIVDLATERQRIEGNSSPVPPEHEKKSAEESSPVAPTQEAAFQAAFQNGIEEIAGLLEEDPVDMRKVYNVILRSALQGFGTTEVAIFVKDSQTRRYRPQFGAGAAYQGFRGIAVARDDDRDVLGLCLQRLEDVLIYDARDPKIAPHLPAWIKNSGFASFVLLPIQENRRPFAILLAGWAEKRTAGFTVAQIRHVRSMLKLAGTARKLADSA